MAKNQKLTRRFSNASETAKILGVHASTIIEWVDRGCPVVSDKIIGSKTRWEFDVDLVKKWREKDLKLRERRRTFIDGPLSLTKDLMNEEEEARFKTIIESLLVSEDG